MASPSSSPPSELTSRVQDFLDDKIQTAADFEGLDALLQQVGEQRQLLRKQLDEVNAHLEKATSALEEHETAVRRKAEAFQKQQSEIDQRLLKITDTKTSDDAVRVFESSMGKIRRLDIAAGYLELLQEVDSLVKNARDECLAFPRAALPAYTRLSSLLDALQAAQPAAEGAAPHLLYRVERQKSDVYAQIRDAGTSDISKTLTEIGWPSKELRIDSKNVERWTEQVKALLDLQEPDLRSRPSNQQNEASMASPPILLPLEIMVHPLQLRFRYHFYGNRPTNRLDKPEYFLSHILDILEDHNAFLLRYVRPILDDRSQVPPGPDDTIYPDAISAFISALLPMVQVKIVDLLPQISSHPQSLSHFMHELMSFDTTLRNTWAYTPIPRSSSEWKGLTWSVLVTHDYFDTWLGIEKDFALSRYEAIISTPDGRDIDYESTESGATKPTKSAIRVNDLLETITERYRLLSSFSQKLRFLIDIQLEIFDQYHQRLRSSLEKYIVDTSTLGKVIQGSAGPTDERRNKNDLHGMYGLESLCKVFGSAEYLERKMSDWGDDIFFLELWDELQDRAGRNTDGNGSVGRKLTTSEVISRTSANITRRNEAQGDGGALFDETALAYRRIRVQGEEQIKNLLGNSVTASLRPYSRVSGWASLASAADTTADTIPSPLAPSPALDGPLHLVSNQLTFLARILGPTPLRRISRSLCLSIQTYMWDNVLLRHRFSASGAAQLQADLTAVQTVIDGSINHQSLSGEAARAMSRLNEAIELLTLPARSDSDPPFHSPSTANEGDEGDEGDEGWGFDDDYDDNNNNNNNNTDTNTNPTPSSPSSPSPGHNDVPETDPTDASSAPAHRSLHTVEKAIFESNQSARSLLAQMGLRNISEADARAVLERRVELRC